MIRGFVKLITAAAVIFAAVWMLLFSYVKLAPETFAVLEKNDTGEARSIHLKTHNFILHGALKNEYTVKIYPLVISHKTEVMIPLPPISDIVEERYSISFFVNTRLRLDTESAFGMKYFASSADPLKAFVASSLNESSGLVFREYIEDGYRRDAIKFRSDEIKEKIKVLLSERVQKNGFSLEGADYSAIKIPSYETYNEGVKFQNELRNEMISNEKEKVAVSGRLRREKLENESRLDYYSSIAKLIKSDPDLLKYIYIDKMAGNVKVVISSDKDLVPDIFTGKTETVKSKEIDNLR